MIKVVLFGICGRMGSLVASELTQIADLKLIAGVEREGHPAIGTTIEDCPVISDRGVVPEADVWLDFSLAEPAVRHAGMASTRGIPIVIAATGFSATAEEELTGYSRGCALLMAPNLSAGVAVFENLCSEAARELPETFEAGIVEIHHRDKKDAPSGTARKLARRVSAFRPDPPVSSLRIGGVTGEHQIRFAGRDEEIILIHRAWSRKAFSSGVGRALKFIAGKKAGLYTLQDIYLSV